MKTALMIASVVGVLGLGFAVRCVPCGTTPPPPPEAPPVVLPPVVIGPEDASALPEDAGGASAEDAGACAPPEPLPAPSACVPRKDIRELCTAARRLCRR